MRFVLVCAIVGRLLAMVCVLDRPAPATLNLGSLSNTSVTVAGRAHTLE